MEIADFLARRARFDEDLWAIELDIADAERFIAETTVSGLTRAPFAGKSRLNRKSGGHFLGQLKPEMPRETGNHHRAQRKYSQVNRAPIRRFTARFTV